MKNQHPIILFGIYIILSLLLLSAGLADAQPGLNVDFHYNGRQYSITGRKINEFTYIFNQGAQKKIQITTLDWQPYIGKDICRQGWVQQLTIAMLASQDYEIVCTFYPWARTIATAETGNTDILYPEYYIEPDAPSDIFSGTRRLDHLALSDKFPGGPIAFIKRKGEKDKYNGDLLNLKDAAIGVVRGYQNTPQFDSLMDQGFFNINEVTDDLTNIKILVAKRVNLIIGDPSVIQFSVLNSDMPEAEKRKILDSIEIVQPAIQDNYLYYAVSKKRPQWKQTLEMLNRVLAEFEKSNELFNIMEKTNTECGYLKDPLPLHPN